MLFQVWLWTITVRFERLRSRFLKAALAFDVSGHTDNAKLVRSKVDKFDSEVDALRKSLATGRTGFFSTYRRLRALLRLYIELRDSTTSALRQILFVLVIFVFITKFIAAHYCVPTGSGEPTILVGDHVLGNKLSYLFRPIKRGDYIICDDPEFVYDKNPVLAWWQRHVGFGIGILGLPDGPVAWTKRIIGLPGDLIEGRIENMQPVIYLNGSRLQEPYINHYPLIAIVREVGFVDAQFLASIPLLSSLNRQLKPAFYTYDDTRDFAQQPFYAIGDNEVIRDSSTYLPIIKAPNVAENYDSFPAMRIPEGYYWAMGDSRRNSRDSRIWGFLPASSVRGYASRVLFSIDTEEPWSIFEFIKHPVDFWLKRVRWSRTLKKIN